MRDDIRAVCFDLDDTLWDLRPVMRRAERCVAEFLAERYPVLAARHSVDDFAEARRALALEQPARAHDFTWLRTEAMRRLALAAGCDEAAGAEAFEVFIDARSTIDPFDDVPPALEALGRRFVLASFSNGNADLRRVMIGAHFRVSLNAESVGHPKPRREAFAALAGALGFHPCDLLYVGDDPAIDVAGARAAGLRAAWMNRRGLAWPDDAGPRADLELRDLGQLAELLGCPPLR